MPIILATVMISSILSVIPIRDCKNDCNEMSKFFLAKTFCKKLVKTLMSFQPIHKISSAIIMRGMLWNNTSWQKLFNPSSMLKPF